MYGYVSKNIRKKIKEVLLFEKYFFTFFFFFVANTVNFEKFIFSLFHGITSKTRECYVVFFFFYITIVFSFKKMSILYQAKNKINKGTFEWILKLRS